MRGLNLSSLRSQLMKDFTNEKKKSFIRVDIKIILPVISLLTCITKSYIMGDMKCVLDTDVLVAGLRSPTGASREIIRMVGRGEIEALATITIMTEYEAVLKRSEHLQAANLTEADVDKLLDTLASIITQVTPHFLWRPMLKDPDDEMILEAAVNGQAEVIITFNTRHFGKAASQFGIEVMKPGNFLGKVRT